MKSERGYYRSTPLSQQQIKEVCERLTNNEAIYKLAKEYKTSIEILFNHWKQYIKEKK